MYGPSFDMTIFLSEDFLTLVECEGAFWPVLIMVRLDLLEVEVAMIRARKSLQTGSINTVHGTVR
jgi:hypothetical protein